jgi:hypothetical protein
VKNDTIVFASWMGGVPSCSVEDRFFFTDTLNKILWKKDSCQQNFSLQVVGDESLVGT